MTRYVRIDSPFGPLLLAGGARPGRLCFPGTDPVPGWHEDGSAFPEARAALAAYFDGTAIPATLPLTPGGTPFQTRVWTALRTIPHGTTASYKDVARAVGRPAATRAVGRANGANPLPILIPCHRVVAADGTLGGFSGPPGIKRALLEMEGALRQPALL